MNTRSLVIMSIFVAIGTVLHFVIPPVFFGIKPDMALAMMFLGIIFFPKIQNVLLLGIVTGLLSALTTGFPGGQIPNIIDKPITAFVFFGLLLLIANKLNKLIGITILTALCTIVSGTIFLGSALFIVGLPPGATFIGLFIAAVLPAVALNAVVIFILYPLVLTILKRSNLLQEA